MSGRSPDANSRFSVVARSEEGTGVNSRCTLVSSSSCCQNHTVDQSEGITSVYACSTVTVIFSSDSG